MDGTDRALDEADNLPALAAGPYRLRGFEPRDLELVRRASADPVIPLISSVPAPYSETEGLQYVERQRHRLRDGYGYSFVIVGEDDRGLGSIGLWVRDLDLGRASVGYWVVEAARRHGVAGHALVALSRWAVDELRIPRLELYCEPWNVASARTAERAGFVFEGLLRSWQEVGGARRDMQMYSLVEPVLP